MPKKHHKTQKKQRTRSIKNFFKDRFSGYIAAGRAKADRYLEARPHRSFRITPERRYKKGKKVGKVHVLVFGSFVTIWREKRLILTLMLLFALTTYLAVGGVSQLNFLDLRQSLQQLFDGNLGALGTVSTLFAAAVTGSLNPSMTQLQQFLWAFLAFLYWLCLVWILRRRLADQPTSIREAVYNSGAPFIASVFVALAIVFQLIPGVIGVLVAVLTLNGAWFQGGVESMLVCGAAVLLVLLTIYWLASTFMAFIIVTIPGMYPWRALSAASDLVVGQKWKIAIRLLVMALTVLVVWALILIPTLFIDNWLRFNWLPLIPILVQLLSAFSVTYAATYAYKMYRSML